MIEQRRKKSAIFVLTWLIFASPVTYAIGHCRLQVVAIKPPWTFKDIVQLLDK